MSFDSDNPLPMLCTGTRASACATNYVCAHSYYTQQKSLDPVLGRDHNGSNCDTLL